MKVQGGVTMNNETLRIHQGFTASASKIGNGKRDYRNHAPAASHHCSSASGVALLADVQAAVAELNQLSCSRAREMIQDKTMESMKGEHSNAGQAHKASAGDVTPEVLGTVTAERNAAVEDAAAAYYADEVEDISSPQKHYSLPYVLLCRVTLAVLMSLYEQKDQLHEAACRKNVDQVIVPILMAYASSLNCSRGARIALEFLHISKVGQQSVWRIYFLSSHGSYLCCHHSCER
ncbi:hypothetical protein CEUSTIGMA_g12306.t1 [Chlamydomonas eustigma]|uniref:Uncharacterized protein n=1 Tax=Chlamydomonas eustigma TaxID=1157962 RepID=A0A250XP78_9CHLO|nr:hypothetical protein CEUSTIGMA_g12306.t1 [Chlamydomonas eustigma]|eukprot:GAX84885.1 hypothetical protein CEUSTIGMA_g12306.t1 [Chlamydomonas eustigma]